MTSSPPTLYFFLQAEQTRAFAARTEGKVDQLRDLAKFCLQQVQSCCSLSCCHSCVHPLVGAWFVRSFVYIRRSRLVAGVWCMPQLPFQWLFFSPHSLGNLPYYMCVGCVPKIIRCGERHRDDDPSRISEGGQTAWLSRGVLAARVPFPLFSYTGRYKSRHHQ